MLRLGCNELISLLMTYFLRLVFLDHLMSEFTLQWICFKLISVFEQMRQVQRIH